MALLVCAQLAYSNIAHLVRAVGRPVSGERRSRRPALADATPAVPRFRSGRKIGHRLEQGHHRRVRPAGWRCRDSVAGTPLPSNWARARGAAGLMPGPLLPARTEPARPQAADTQRCRCGSPVMTAERTL